MKIKRETGFIPDFSGTADYDLYYDYNIYREIYIFFQFIEYNINDCNS